MERGVRWWHITRAMAIEESRPLVRYRGGKFLSLPPNVDQAVAYADCLERSGLRAFDASTARPRRSSRADGAAKPRARRVERGPVSPAVKRSECRGGFRTRPETKSRPKVGSTEGR